MSPTPHTPLRALLGALAFLGLAAASAPAQGTDATEVRPDKGLRVRTDRAFDGLTLFAPLLSRNVYLVDLDGELVHTWEGELAPGNSVYLLDSGNLLRCYRLEDNPVFHGGGIGGRVVEQTWDGEVVWDFTLSTPDRMQHHDIEPLPNGNVLFIVWERLSPDEAVAVGRDPAQVSPEGLWPDAVLEIEPVRPDGGRVVWEWHALDHLVQDASPSRPFHGNPAEEPGRLDVNVDHRDRPPMTEEEREELEEQERQMRALGYVGGEEDEEEPRSPRGPGGSSPDWLHTNSIDYNPELDLILLSSPRLNEIWILDHSTTTEEAAGPLGGRRGRGGELLYRWGNPRNYGGGERSDQRLFAQHDAQWIPAGHPGAGNVLVFNNGNGRPGGEHSSVDELVLPFPAERSGGVARPAGGAFGPLRPVWSYRSETPSEFYSFFISGAQRLPNGNTLVCSGAQGRFFEVTPEGEVVWEYWNPFGGEVQPSFGRAGGPGGADWMDRKACFRATRLARDHPGLAGRL